MAEAPADELNTTSESKFWTNELIWNELTSYLRISDLKALSLVNKHLLQKVRTHPRLIFKQILREDFELCAPRIDKAIVVVDRIDEDCLKDLGPNIFENVSYLKLQQFGGTELTDDKKIHKIVGYCKSLKSLSLSIVSFGFQDCLNGSSVKNILSQLEELHVGIGNNFYPRLVYLHYASSKFNSFENSKTISNLNLQLKKFSYRDPVEIEFVPIIFDIDSFFYPDIILVSSLNSLVEINLHLHISGLIRIRDLHMPNLTKLQLKIDKINTASNLKVFNQVFLNALIPFTKRHFGKLEAFSLKTSESYSLEPFCDVFKSSKKIKLLSFSTDGNFTRSIRNTNWNFLQKLSTLRSFELKKDPSENDRILDDFFDNESEDDEVPDWRIWRRPKFDFMKELLSVLPSSLTNIRLSGFTFNNITQNYLIITELERFKSLTELSMTKCPAFLDDKTLQLICSQLTTLRILRCIFDGVTDFGLSGLKDDGSDSGISLKNLKGLNTLKMARIFGDRWRITWNGLLNAIQFLNLVKLKVEAHVSTMKVKHDERAETIGISGKNYLKLIQQNPSLETCCLWFYEPNARVRQETLRIHSRLKLEKN